MTVELQQLRSMDADQLAVWVCLHPTPNRADREALSRLLAELQPGVRG